MTVDLATLNLKVDSREVTQGVGQLDRLTAAGAKAEQSTDRLGRSFVKASSEAGRLRLEEAKLEAEVQRLIQAQERAALSARAQEIAQQRLGQTVVRSAGAQRAGMQQLSYQLGDMATMFAMGARPMQIFASQGGQVIQSVQLMTGASRGFIGFLAGPWGMAITSAITVLGALGAQYLATADDAEEAVSKLDAALARFRSGLAQSSELSQAMTEATRERVGLLADLALAERQLRAAESQAGNNSAMNAADAGNIESQAIAARQRVEAIRSEIESVDSRMNQAIEESRLRNRLDSEAAARAEAREEAEERGTRSTRARTVALSAESRAQQQQTRETDRYIQSLEDEYARLTMSEDAYRAREVAMRRGEATTDAQRAAIDRLTASIEAARAAEMARAEANEVQAKIDEYAQQYQDKIKAEVDAQAEIDEEARRLEEERIRDMAGLYQALFSRGIDGIWDYFKRQGIEALSTLASQGVLRLLGGSASSSPVSGVMNLLGGSAANDNGKGITSAAGGLGGLLKGATASPANFMQTAGMAVAAISLAANLAKSITGLFGSPKGIANLSGSALLSSSGKLGGQASGLGGSVLDTIAQIADALGATVSGGAVSVGIKGKNFRVDPTGAGRVKGAGVIDFGKDQQAAIEYAVRNLIEDGVLGGISQAAKNLLGAGGDLEKAIEQATLIESLPKLLKARLDPLGAALDDIDERFTKLVDALRAGGATAQQFADAERLYNLEREEAIAQIGSAAQTLKDFASSLAYGSNSPLSVRSQLASARTALAGLDPTKDQEKYVAAAQQVLALSRQANGSSGAYFADFTAINGQLQGAISSIESRTTTAGPGTVFQQQTASNTATMAQMLQDHTALLRSIDAKLTANDNVATAVTIGSSRGFVA